MQLVESVKSINFNFKYELYNNNFTSQTDGESEVFVAGDPERKHMLLSDKLGGIPYQKKQINLAVSSCSFSFLFSNLILIKS